MNPEDVLVRDGRLTPRPRHRWPTVTVARLDMDVLFNCISEHLIAILMDHNQLRRQYDGTSAEIEAAINHGIEHLTHQMMNELWNRLRLIAETHSMATRGQVFTRKAPTFEGFEMPRFIASLLSGIGPLIISDSLRDTIVIYAPAYETRDYYGRDALQVIDTLAVARTINNLRAAGIPLGTIQMRGSQGAFFTTCSTETVEPNSVDIYGAFHASHYTRNDVIMAMLFGSFNSESNPFEDLSLTIGFVNNENVINAFEDLDIPVDIEDEDVERHVLGTYNIRYSGIAPASNVPVNERGKGIYVLGRGAERHALTSLARNLSNLEMDACLRYRILNPPPAAGPPPVNNHEPPPPPPGGVVAPQL